jgi:hypothetical protein
VAGTGVRGFSGDKGIKVDSEGSLYIPEFLNHCVRKVSNGVITAVARNGT